MADQQRQPSRTESALQEQRSIIDLLTTRCCQHAADTSAVVSERDTALATVAERDKRISELESEIVAFKSTSEQTKV